jgi:ankyrin repeat protein
MPGSGDCLERAAAYSSICVLDLLLAHGARRIPMMVHLLELGVDVDEADRGRRSTGGGSPLHHALLAGCLETVRSLLENGTDPSCENGYGEIAVQVAERSGEEKLVGLIARASKF